MSVKITGYPLTGYRKDQMVEAASLKVHTNKHPKFGEPPSFRTLCGK